MKRYIIFVLVAVLLLTAGCQKTEISDTGSGEGSSWDEYFGKANR